MRNASTNLAKCFSMKIVLPRKHTSTYKRRYFCQVFENPYTEPPKVEGNKALQFFFFFVVCRVVNNLESTWIPILWWMFWLKLFYWLLFILTSSEDRSTRVHRLYWLKCLNTYYIIHYYVYIQLHSYHSVTSLLKGQCITEIYLIKLSVFISLFLRVIPL